MKKLIAISTVKHGGEEYLPGKPFQVESQKDIDFLVGGGHASDSEADAAKEAEAAKAKTTETKAKK